jgi:hypothetical protein
MKNKRSASLNLLKSLKASEFRQKKFCLLLGAGLLLLPIMGQAAGEEMEDETSSKEWKEVTLSLPAAPKTENLVSFYDSPTQSFAIDIGSLTLASDNTIRYTLVSSSNTGVKNISYEGLRCETAEKKLFAFGRSDGSWSRSRRMQWVRISDAGLNKQHITLFQEYFCEGKTTAGKASQMINRIKNKQPITPF